MARPLELAYSWRPAGMIATAAAALCIFLLARGRVEGWGTVALLVIVAWAAYLTLIFLRTRAYLLVDGSRLTVRRYRGLHTFQADQLTHVKEFLTSRGPSYVLTVREPTGRTVKRVAPTALLRGGHSTLFGWILARAPHAELDRGSRRTVERLQIRGLIT